MPTTLSSEPSLAHEEVTPAQEILPTSPLYMPPANVPTKQATCDGRQISLQLERVEESVDKIRGRHRRKQARTTGKSLNIVVSY